MDSQHLSETAVFNAERLNDNAEARRITEAQLLALQAKYGARLLGEVLISMRSRPGVITRPAPYLDRVCAGKYIDEWNRLVDSNYIDPRVPTTISRKWVK